MINLRERLLHRKRGVPNYLTFEALETGTFTLTIPSAVPASVLSEVSYSLDNGSTWVTTVNDSTDITITTPSVDSGDTIMWKGTGNRYHDLNTATDSGGARFSSTGTFNLYGELLSLLKGDNFMTQRTVSSYFNFIGLFYQSKVVDASALIFPDNTSIPQRIYQGMFRGCTELLYAPVQIMPEETTLIEGRAFLEMFRGCTSLLTAPEHIYGQTTNIGGCQQMFDGCTNLVNAPVLHQTTVNSYGYYYMFQNCKALVTAPTVVATSFPSTGGCECWNMFYGCTSLTTANFTLLPTTVNIRTYMQMFHSCSNLVAGPTINATSTTGINTMWAMFRGCSKLQYSQITLSIGVLSNGCYNTMFYGCSKINNVKILATDVSGTNCLQLWLYGVATGGTLTATAGLNLPSGDNGVPTSWTLIEI